MIRYDFNQENMGVNNLQVEIHQHQKVERKSSSPFIIPMPQTIDDHPLESWVDINPKKLPVYSERSNNIFLQLQEAAIPGCALGDEDVWQNPLKYICLPAPDDLPVDENLAYFLSNRMDAFLGFQHCFSSAYKRLYLLSANTAVLRHTLFAFIKFLNERDRLLQSAVCNMHISKAAPQLQLAITYLTFDDSHILSVPLLAYLAYWLRKVDVAKAHIEGFYKMLIHAGYLERDKYGKVSVSSTMPSLVLLMWRLAVRLDHYIGFMDPDQETIPLIQSTSGSSRRYITDFIDSSASQWIDCLVLTDELEDLRNMAVHFNRRTTILRNSTDYTPEQAQSHISKAGQKILRKINSLEGDILNAANKYNETYTPEFTPMWYMNLEPFPSTQFLHYASLFKNLHHRFIEAVVVNRATLIHTTITSHPTRGPHPIERLSAAMKYVVPLQL